MQFDPTLLAKFPKGKKKTFKPYSSKRTRIGVIFPPKELGCTFTKKNPSMCNLVPFPLLIGYPRTKISQIKFLWRRTLLDYPKENIHPCAT
jgi:hypothetical protein